MSWQKRKQLAEQRAQTLADMQGILTVAETDSGRDLTAEESTTFDGFNTRAEDLNRQIERYDRMIALAGDPDAADPEERSNRPGRENVDPSTEERDQRVELESRAMRTFLRQGVDGLQGEELRSLTISGQGVVGTRTFSSTIFDKMKMYVGVREAGAEVITTDTGTDMLMAVGDDTSNTGRLVAEAGTNANVTEPTIANTTLGAYKFSSDWIKLSHELLQDTGYDVEGYIRAKAAERIGRAFNTYCTTGTGSSQPHGVVTASTAGKVAASTTTITYEELLDLIHAVDAAYRAMPAFGIMLHDTTLAAIRKMKDTAGSYIWAPGAAGQPDRVLGYKYVANNSMAQLSSGVSSKVVIAGDFNRVVVRDVTKPTIIRAVEKFADDGLVGFKIDSRHDCRITDTSAIKHLALAAA